MKKGWIWMTVALAVLSTGSLQHRAPAPSPAEGPAQRHHQRGVEFHIKRCLDEASREYAAALKLDPPAPATAEQNALARRFLPRLFTTPSEPFRLQDFAVIL